MDLTDDISGPEPVHNDITPHRTLTHEENPSNACWDIICRNQPESTWRIDPNLLTIHQWPIWNYIQLISAMLLPPCHPWPSCKMQASILILFFRNLIHTKLCTSVQLISWDSQVWNLLYPFQQCFVHHFASLALLLFIGYSYSSYLWHLEAVSGNV